MTKKRNRKAFTVVELVIVIAVIAVLATVLVPTFSNIIQNAQDSKAMQEAKNAYTSYMVEYAGKGEIPEYMVYELDGRFVALKSGSVVGLYESSDEALEAMGLAPDKGLTDLGVGKLFAYCGVNNSDESNRTQKMQYDDYCLKIGDIYAGDSAIKIADEAYVEVLEVDGAKMFHAKGVGTTTLTCGELTYQVTVIKAKINIITIMGQSNAGNHFVDATSDITNPIGTAYWWKNGATAPVDYTQSSKGWHAPLLAELYAQSAAAGNPVKNVMVWHEGTTSKNGRPITDWVSARDNTTGLNGTVTMVQNCLNYYAQHNDKYEIVGNGVYWYQGESDWNMDPSQYTALFMTLWNRLKNEADMDYVAFFRVRHGVMFENTAEFGATHEDLYYHKSLAAQLKMINDTPEFYLATSITENWTGVDSTEHTIDISKYITVMNTYGNSATHTDAYGNNATYANGKLTTTMYSLFGAERDNWCHYGKFGAALIGADAAYNMYYALHGNGFSIVQGDTSGKPEHQTFSVPGAQVMLDITEMTENLAFRAACGSTAGTMQINVHSGAEDITNAVTVTGNNSKYGTVNTARLRDYDNVTITVTYTSDCGGSGMVIYNITNRIVKDELSIYKSAVGNSVMFYQNVFKYFGQNQNLTQWGSQVCAVDVSAYVDKTIEITAAQSVVAGAYYSFFTTTLPDGVTLDSLSSAVFQAANQTGEAHETMLKYFSIAIVDQTMNTIVVQIPDGAKYLVFSNLMIGCAEPSVYLLDVKQN